MGRRFLYSVVLTSVICCLLIRSLVSALLGSTEKVKELMQNPKSLILGMMPDVPYLYLNFRCFNCTLDSAEGEVAVRTVFYRKWENVSFTSYKFQVSLTARDGVGVSLLDVAPTGSESLPALVDRTYTVIFVTGSCIILRDDKTAFLNNPIFLLWQQDGVYDADYYECVEVYDYISSRSAFDSRKCNNCCDSMPQVMGYIGNQCGFRLSNADAP
ncbi:uncharacterized protein LOC119402816 [Rhipicephalus sanguineus]|uniref:uncharacterized protein LOC119402816 n=1 Tax=Rhipicephalus sanguineus TaxID=34632 RepID=UPI0020C3804E|nr:uncharacterized protein LOC119402816 [Rhipicephalus sanguineus]